MEYIRNDSFSFTHSRGLKLINKKGGCYYGLDSMGDVGKVKGR